MTAPIDLIDHLALSCKCGKKCCNKGILNAPETVKTSFSKAFMKVERVKGIEPSFRYQANKIAFYWGL